MLPRRMNIVQRRGPLIRIGWRRRRLMSVERKPCHSFFRNWSPACQFLHYMKKLLRFNFVNFRRVGVDDAWRFRTPDPALAHFQSCCGYSTCSGGGVDRRRRSMHSKRLARCHWITRPRQEPAKTTPIRSILKLPCRQDETHTHVKRLEINNILDQETRLDSTRNLLSSNLLPQRLHQRLASRYKFTITSLSVCLSVLAKPVRTWDSCNH